MIEVENEEGQTIQRRVRVNVDHKLIKDDPSMFVRIERKFEFKRSTEDFLVNFQGFS